MIEGMPSHEYAVTLRVGKRQFGCSVCDYNCYSHKWVNEHIEQMLKYEQCPAPGGMIGDHMGPDIHESCQVCNKRTPCETEKLETDLATMKLEGDMALRDPTTAPLIGLGKYVRLYDEKQNRLTELMEMK